MTDVQQSAVITIITVYTIKHNCMIIIIIGIIIINVGIIRANMHSTERNCI